MRSLVTPEEMAAADQAAISSGTPAEALMERAGRAVARVAIRMLGGRYGKKVVIVCGKGNNGGDGYVAERVLRREGIAARAFPVGEIEARHLDGADLVIDAVFGTGFHGAATDPAITFINRCGAPTLAVDIPSGVDGLTGAVQGDAVHADITVAIAAQKIGTAVGEGAKHSGVVEVVDIGIPVPDTSASMTDRAFVAGALPARDLDSHKRSRGSVAILGGSLGMSGAVILAAEAAIRAGSGFVTAGVTKEVQPIVASSIPEILTRAVAAGGGLGPEALGEFKPVLEKATALAIGPGLGQGEGQRELVLEALRSVDLPIVLDADGLNVVAGHTSDLTDRTASLVITPHPAELARLLEMTVQGIQSDRVKVARAASQSFGCVVVLKGFRTLIASGEAVVVNPTGGPSLATAGTGDVLTGVIATFLAQGLDPFDAAVAGVYVHGLAGDLSGDEGVIAGDVADNIAAALDLL
jgi:NAD(P)H-hydrate epimerase